MDITSQNYLNNDVSKMYINYPSMFMNVSPDS